MGHYLIHISHSFIRTFTALARSKHSDKIVLTFSIQEGRINGNKNMPSTFPDNIISTPQMEISTTSQENH